MDLKNYGNWIATIGVLVTLAGIFLPNFLSKRSSKLDKFREKSAPLLETLLEEISAIEGGSYPFKKIDDFDFAKLLAFAPQRRIPALKAAFAQYNEAHKISDTTHWHDAHSEDSGVIFANAFILNNPKEVLEKMQPLLKELSK